MTVLFRAVRLSSQEQYISVPGLLAYSPGPNTYADVNTLTVSDPATPITRALFLPAHCSMQPLEPNLCCHASVRYCASCNPTVMYMTRSVKAQAGHYTGHIVKHVSYPYYFPCGGPMACCRGGDARRLGGCANGANNDSRQSVTLPMASTCVPG